MPARDALHPIVVRCLIADGWEITHDPYLIPVGQRNLFVDLGAEKIVAAEREGKRIAVEIKSFQGPSEVRALEEALGQYFLYTPFLQSQEPERVLYLAIPHVAYVDLFEEPIGKGLMAAYDLRLLVFDEKEEVIKQWIPEP